MSNKDNLIERINIRLTWKERKALKKSAAEHKLNTSDYIRQHVPELQVKKWGSKK
jgi:predicted DNA binding CopG/RHH family protein